MNNNNRRNKAVEEIRKQVRMFNLIVLITVYSLLFLTVKFLYGVLDYLPAVSFAAILSMVALLVVGGMYVMNRASKRAIGNIEEYVANTESLLSTTRHLREMVHTDVLLEDVVESSMKMTGAEAASLFLADGDSLEMKVAKGNGNGRIEGLSMPKTRGVAGWVFSNLAPTRVEDVRKDDRFNPLVDQIVGHETRSLLCVPLSFEDSQPLGVLELLNKRNGSFSSEDEEILSYFAGQASMAIRRARFFEDQKNYEIFVTNILITAMDNFIYEKSGHAKRVAKYSLLMARGLEMTEHDQSRLYRACLLHDIGFLKMKPGTALRSEYRSHSEFGYEMLSPISFYSDIAPIVLHHHERVDGRGYPTGLKGDDIPLESRIIAIAEAFDAMVSSNSYRVTDNFNGVVIPAPERFSYAVRELTVNSGTQFDAGLVKIFVEVIDEGAIQL